MQQYVFSLSAPAHSIKYRWAHLSSSVFLASPVKRSVDVSPVHEDTNQYSHHQQRVCVCFCFCLSACLHLCMSLCVSVLLSYSAVLSLSLSLAFSFSLARSLARSLFATQQLSCQVLPWPPAVPAVPAKATLPLCLHSFHAQRACPGRREGGEMPVPSVNKHRQRRNRGGSHPSATHLAWSQSCHPLTSHSLRRSSTSLEDCTACKSAVSFIILVNHTVFAEISPNI